jgi:hypothetical protein
MRASRPQKVHKGHSDLRMTRETLIFLSKKKRMTRETITVHELGKMLVFSVHMVHASPFLTNYPE